MKKRLYRSKASGQSIPLLAVMIAVLFGMAALALDVGNTYAQQREAVRATDAASLEGINKVIENESDISVRDQILNSFKSHKIDATFGAPAAGQMQIQADYLDASGTPIPNCPVGSCSKYDQIRSNITYIRVQIDGKVETYFARLAGRPDLPVHAVAHARRGICSNGIYPISVDVSLLDTAAGRFKNPDATYSDEFFRNKTLKRINLKEDLQPGNFGWLRWDSDGNGNAQTFGDALTGQGTYSQGFTEAGWPTQGSPLVEPEGYPLLPGELSSGDWIATATGNMQNNAVRAAFDSHILNRTIMTLPLYDYTTGNGTNAVYHSVGTGRFYLRAYGKEPQGGPWYIDLVYLGPGAECASNVVAPNVPRLMALEGQVSLYPHFAQREETGDLPIQYIIVLDVSGSMSWNFDGYANNGGSTVRCQGSGAVQCLPGTVWSNANERRIKIAADTLKQFANSVRPQDQVRIVTFSNTYGAYPMGDRPGLDEALYGLSNVYPDGWTSDKATITAAIEEAASFGGSYETQGETPSAIGLARAFDTYESSPTREPGTGKLYKRAVIFLTDGVANVTRDGQLWAGTQAQPCGAEDVDCQSGTFADGTAKPINAMNIEAEVLKAQITPEDKGKGGLYVIALGPTSLEALQLVSSDGKVERADDAGSLQRTLDRIRDQVTFGTCSDGVVRTNPVEQISAGGLPDYSLPAISGRISAPEMGEVTLTGSSGDTYNGKIIFDSDTGRLYYRITDIPPGQYTMTYWMAYRSPEDNATRIYQYAEIFGGGDGALTASSQSVSMEPSSDNFGSRILPITLDLDPTADVCATTPAP
jgi:hypothetical protein